MSGRWPARVYGAGDEPDPRFSLANERTFLAWVRTSLALLAGGVALEALELPVAPGLRTAAALVLVLLAALGPVQAWLGWAGTEQAMRRRSPLPSSAGASLVLVAGTVVTAVLLGVGLLLGP